MCRSPLEFVFIVFVIRAGAWVSEAAVSAGCAEARDKAVLLPHLISPPTHSSKGLCIVHPACVVIVTLPE